MQYSKFQLQHISKSADELHQGRSLGSRFTYSFSCQMTKCSSNFGNVSHLMMIFFLLMKVFYYQGHKGQYELTQSTSAITTSSQETNTTTSKWNLVNGQTNEIIAQSKNHFLLGSCPENRTKRYVIHGFPTKREIILIEFLKIN